MKPDLLLHSIFSVFKGLKSALKCSTELELGLHANTGRELGTVQALSHDTGCPRADIQHLIYTRPESGPLFLTKVTVFLSLLWLKVFLSYFSCHKTLWAKEKILFPAVFSNIFMANGKTIKHPWFSSFLFNVG